MDRVKLFEILFTRRRTETDGALVSLIKEIHSELIRSDLMEKFPNFLAITSFVLVIERKNSITCTTDEIFRNMKINYNEKTHICEEDEVKWIN